MEAERAPLINDGSDELVITAAKTTQMIQITSKIADLDYGEENPRTFGLITS